MSASPKPHPTPTLDEFLRMPDIEEAPGLEYRSTVASWRRRCRTGITDGSRWGSPDGSTSSPSRKGSGSPKSRCAHTFAGRSILPDASFQLAERVDLKPDGTSQDSSPIRPTSTSKSSPPINPCRRPTPSSCTRSPTAAPSGSWSIRSGRPSTSTAPVGRPSASRTKGAIDFAPVLPGLVIPVAEVFSWMTIRLNRPGAGPGMSEDGAKLRLSFDAGTLLVEGLPEEDDPRAARAQVRPAHRAVPRRGDLVPRRSSSTSAPQQIPYTDAARDYEPTPGRSGSPRRRSRTRPRASQAWWTAGGRGVVVLPTGTGKTHLANLAIEKAGRPTLVVTPTIDLMNQWYDELTPELRRPRSACSAAATTTSSP